MKRKLENEICHGNADLSHSSRILQITVFRIYRALLEIY